MELAELKRTLRPGDRLFKEGDSGDSVYFVESGQFDVTTSQTGASVLAVIGPNEIVGEIALFDHQPRIATVTCSETAEVVAIDSQLLRKQVEAADPLVRVLVDGLLYRLRGTIEQIRKSVTSKAATGSSAPPSSLQISGPVVVDRQDKLSDGVLQKIKLQQALLLALERDEFRLHWQPIHSLKCGRTAGYEVLIRWQHPERGLIAPAEFIQHAEESGAILPIGRWVFREALSGMERLQKIITSENRPFVSANLSPLQFTDPDLVPYLREALQSVSLNPGQLKIEVTEGTLIGDPDAALTLLRSISETGTRLAIDDFGTGYSSLSYLQRLPFNSLKIDRSFVTPVDKNPQSAKIVKAIIELANALQMDTIAEGIETESVANTLTEMGCKFGQGFHLGRPLSLEKVEAMLLEEQHC